MSVESFLPFVLLFSPLLLAFVLEAAVLTAFRIQRFWKAFAVSVLLNLLSLTSLFYLVPFVLQPLGYDAVQFNGLTMPLRVVAFLWWFATLLEGFLLTLCYKRQPREKLFLCAAIMNALSFSLFYLFVTFSH